MAAGERQKPGGAGVIRTTHMIGLSRSKDGAVCRSSCHARCAAPVLHPLTVNELLHLLDLSLDTTALEGVRDLSGCEVAVTVFVKLGEDVVQGVVEGGRGDAPPALPDLGSRAQRQRQAECVSKERGRVCCAPQFDVWGCAGASQATRLQLTAAANCCMPGMRSWMGLADSSACMKASWADSRSSWGPTGMVVDCRRVVRRWPMRPCWGCCAAHLGTPPWAVQQSSLVPGEA